MADIRIKDLTTTASSTASDDFIAVDGTTNGTRKLSAFSPTFGGNPTISGTLTVNGTSLASALVINGNGLALNTDGSASIRFLEGTTTSKWWIYKLSSDPNLYFRDMVNGRMQMTLVPNATSGTAISYLFSNLVVDSSAISTTTATGALVVSGGVGVGGAINAGGTITSTNGSGSGLLGMRSSSGNASYVFWSETGVADRGILGFNNGSSTLSYRSFSSSFSTGTEVFSISSAGNTTVAGTLTVNGGTASVASANGTTSSMIRSTVGGTATTGNGIFSSYLSSLIEWQFGGVSSDSSFRISSNGLGTADQFKISSSGNVSIPSTQASASTSSGALVVSGGVGVAGAIFAGGGISTKLSTNNSGSNLFAITRADGTTHLLTATDASDGLTLKFGYTGLGNSSNWVSASGTGAGTAITINNGVVASGGGVIYQVNGLSRWYLARDASTSESGSNVGSDFLITAYNDAGSSLGTALTIKRSDYAATFGGSIKTAAPSGGTAANWKLGTVATVSPTSPNRTIEVDIGGTIYYIHAKTTNN